MKFGAAYSHLFCAAVNNPPGFDFHTRCVSAFSRTRICFLSPTAIEPGSSAFRQSRPGTASIPHLRRPSPRTEIHHVAAKWHRHRGRQEHRDVEGQEAHQAPRTGQGKRDQHDLAHHPYVVRPVGTTRRIRLTSGAAPKDQVSRAAKMLAEEFVSIRALHTLRLGRQLTKIEGHCLEHQIPR